MRRNTNFDQDNRHLQKYCNTVSAGRPAPAEAGVRGRPATCVAAFAAVSISGWAL